MLTTANALRTGMFAASAVAVLAASFPVSAALWPAIPTPSTGEINLAIYDNMARIGEAQRATDPFCDVPDVVAISLSEDHAEQIVLSAMNPDGTRFDFWASEQSGTWTVTYARSDGITCVVGSGTGWTNGGAPSLFMHEAGITL